MEAKEMCWKMNLPIWLERAIKPHAFYKHKYVKAKQIEVATK
ncbi:MAG: hypothetical protein QXT30_08120 [Candidatus Bathyarchaeia archaeon]